MHPTCSQQIGVSERFDELQLCLLVDLVLLLRVARLVLQLDDLSCHALHRLQILLARRYGLVKQAHLQFTQCFIVVQSPVASVKLLEHLFLIDLAGQEFADLDHGSRLLLV